MSRIPSFRIRSLASATVLGLAVLFAGSAHAELPAALATKVAKYQKQLVDWAAQPLMVSSVKDANAKGGFLPGMTNAKWNDLDDKDPSVLATMNSPAG